MCLASTLDYMQSASTDIQHNPYKKRVLILGRGKFNVLVHISPIENHPFCLLAHDTKDT